MVYTADLNSAAAKTAYGFESRPRHHQKTVQRTVWAVAPLL